ncbi:AAA family ATPase [Kitasatospora sp. NPDC006697]|uniref:AAA family ATPase n=1 Tax=Kitasatospora sp. NPDC006697 TaxID=3364020 RepID=UPI003679CE61
MNGTTPIPAGGHQPDAARLRFRARTALLNAFSADELERCGEQDAGPSAALGEFLTRDCERVTTREGRRWRLTSEVRIETLRSLATPERLLAGLAELPPDDGRDLARAWAERFLAGNPPPLEGQDADQLFAALTVLGWFESARPIGLGVRLPSTDSVRGLLRRARLLQPLAALADRAFTGREDELGALAEHLDAGPSGAAPWLVVHGPGGVGKSTLLARFLLAGARSGRAVRQFYLTFERPEFTAEEPLTLLAEAARQLAILVPALRARAEELESAVRNTVSADRREAKDRHARSGRRAARERDTELLIGRFADLLDSPGPEPAESSVPLVLDTFELVQRTGPLAQGRLLDFLEQLNERCPRLRIVAAGRAPIDDPRCQPLPLAGFDPATARAFLRRQTPGLTLTDSQLDTVADTVGRYPLNLKLAAALLRREPESLAAPGGLTDPELRDRLAAETVQGVLYRRILDHLDDQDLRMIASPGLAVRRVTPEIIRRVLAEPCGLGELDERGALELFRRFRAEVSLVAQVPGWEEVVHRADVRAVMLPLLRRDHAATVDLIHRRAAAYYRALRELDVDRVVDRAEELYHLLALDRPAAELDLPWSEEAGRLVEPAAEELPPRARAYLAERLRHTAPAELRAAAEPAIWRPQARRAATELYQDGRVDEALAVVLERPELVRSDLELTSLTIKLLSAKGRWRDSWLQDHARMADSRTIDLSPLGLELAITRARAAEDAGDFELARGLLEQAWRDLPHRERPESAPLLLGLGAARLRLFRRGGALGAPQARELRAELVARARAMDLSVLAEQPTLAWELAAEIGDEVPELVALTADRAGIDLSTGGLGSLRNTLTSEAVADFARTTGVDPESVTAVGDRTSTDIGESIGRYLAAGGDVQSLELWNTGVVANYQHAVDLPAFPGDGAPDHATTQDAVVFLPGFLGSSLTEAETGRQVWGGSSLTGSLLGVPGRYSAVLRVTDAERLGRTGRLIPTGLLDTPAYFPLLGTAEPYRELVDTLRRSVPHPDALLLFPYDWRLPAASSGELLAAAARRHLAAWTASPHRAAHPDRPEPRLVFVAHSSGGLVARAALAADRELASSTRDLVTIATPFHGTPAVARQLPGPRGGFTAGAAALAAGLPGLYDLLPDYPCVETPEGVRHLRTADIPLLGGDAELAAAAAAARGAQLLAPFMPRTRAVVGIGQPTIQSLRLERDGFRPLHTAVRLTRDGDLQRTASGQAVRWDRGGDGLVPRDCAAPEASNAALYVSGRHGSLPTAPQVLEFIHTLLTEQRPTARLQPLPVLDALDRPGLGLVLPDRVAPGQTWPLMVAGAEESETPSCVITDAISGSVVATPQLRRRDTTLTAGVTLARAGLYRVTISCGADRVSELLPVTQLDGGR